MGKGTCINYTGDRIELPEGLAGDAESVAQLAKHLISRSDDIANLINVEDYMKTADGIVSRFTGYDTVEAFNKNADESGRKALRTGIEVLTEQLAAASVDISKLREDHLINDSVFRIYGAVQKINGGAATTHDILSMKAITGGMFEVAGERYRVMSAHPAARKYWADYHLLSQHIKNEVGTSLNRVTDFVKKFERNGIDNRALIEFLPYLDGVGFDGAVPKDLREDFMMSDHFKKLRDAMTKTGEYSDDQVTDAFVESLRSFQREWNRVNYGVDDPQAMGDKYNPREYKNSVTGTIYSIGDKLVDLIKMRSSIAGEHALSYQEREYLRLFGNNEFRLRQNYIPSRRGDEPDPYDSLIFTDPTDKVNIPGIPDWMKTRKNAIEKSDDFTKIMKENLLSFAWAADMTGLYSMKSGLREALDATPQSWKDENRSAASAITYFADVMDRYFEKDRSKRKAHVEAARNLSIATTSMFGLMLGMPKTALANYLGGGIGFLSQYGADIAGMKRDFDEAFAGKSGDTEREIASLVSSVVESEFMSSGRMAEFIEREGIIDTPDSGKLVAATKYARDMSMKVADFGTSKGIFFFLPFMQAFTMKGSEERMRRMARVVLYDKATSEIQAKIASGAIEKSDTEAIKSIIDSHKEDTYMSMGMALGEFSPLNRPFWTWMTRKDADTLGKVVLGTAASMWWTFRQVGMHNINMIVKAGVETFNPKNNMTIPQRMKSGSLPGMFLMLMLAGYDIATRVLKRGTPRATFVLNANPFQELTTMAHGAKLFAPMLNINVSEAEAEEIKENLLRLAGGAFAGHSLEKVFDKMAEDDETAGSFKELISNVGNVTHIGLALTNYLDTMGVEEYYDAKKEMSKGLDNPVGFTNYSNSFLNFYSRMVPLAARGETQGDSRQIMKAKATDLRRALASAFGISMSQAPEYYDRAFLGSSRSKFAYDRADITAQQISHEFGDFSQTPLGRMMYQIKKYGRIYPDSAYGVDSK